jgi:drug/metabolite transporter (DMT)-like permease
VLLLPLVAVFPPPGPVTLPVAAGVAGLGILGSGVAYLLFYRLIDRLGPARTATVNLLVPISGVLGGWCCSASRSRRRACSAWRRSWWACAGC